MIQSEKPDVFRICMNSGVRHADRAQLHPTSPFQHHLKYGMMTLFIESVRDLDVCSRSRYAPPTVRDCCTCWECVMSPRLRQFAAPVTVFAQQGLAQQQVVLLLCCIMHAIHDGYTSAMYLLLPLIATDLQLSYAQVGFLKTLISGGQSLFQLPGGIIAERVGERRMLALGLATLSGAFLLLSPAWSFPTVATLCLLIGVGASLQHPLSSSLVSRAYEAQGRRTAMGTYNFAGDVGKVAFPALLSGMILVLSWRGSVELLGAFGLVAALVVWMGGKSRERVAHTHG